ncbi:excalibur calcium-binding domain-containing protein [Thalassotalea sp. G2M2-11]|uniref:excalibur calcium-binding domain-containing protein n=1 Tax=Thalassotalea sp. G2M2-11 TaxID=2787627 RepID=UPI0019CFCF8D|nr:excalibur calcium-binding domain-containing protein [Thalassotalea sp. G2M2-11]
MKKALILGFIVFAVWKYYTDSMVKADKPLKTSEAQEITHAIKSPIERTIKASQQQAAFECDGRQYCSQMTSCAEATYYIQHCPNTKMDGDNDGVPCERQWCR